MWGDIPCLTLSIKNLLSFFPTACVLFELTYSMSFRLIMTTFLKDKMCLKNDLLSLITLFR